jgi:hypothetical protein
MTSVGRFSGWERRILLCTIKEFLAEKPGKTKMRRPNDLLI